MNDDSFKSNPWSFIEKILNFLSQWKWAGDKRKETKQRRVEVCTCHFHQLQGDQTTSFEVLKMGSEKGEREKQAEMKKFRNLKELKIGD